MRSCIARGANTLPMWRAAWSGAYRHAVSLMSGYLMMGHSWAEAMQAQLQALMAQESEVESAVKAIQVRCAWRYEGMHVPSLPSRQEGIVTIAGRRCDACQRVRVGRAVGGCMRPVCPVCHSRGVHDTCVPCVGAIWQSEQESRKQAIEQARCGLWCCTYALRLLAVCIVMHAMHCDRQRTISHDFA